MNINIALSLLPFLISASLNTIIAEIRYLYKIAFAKRLGASLLNMRVATVRSNICPITFEC